MMRSRLAILFLLLFSTLPLLAQDRGAIGIALVGQNAGGSEESFRTQNDLRSGFVLEELTLRYGAAELRASGFGSAEPWGRARVRFAAASPWSFALDYDRRRSFFALANPDVTLHGDRWHIERWRAEAGYDGWRTAHLGLALRHTARSGHETVPLFALNEKYLLGRALEDTMNEAAFSIETRTLPVRLAFEQSYTRFEQRDRRAPESPLAAGGDPDLFAASTSSQTDRERYPTSRLTAAWGSDRFVFAGSLLYSPAKLRASGTTTSQFDLNGGTVGRVLFIDDAISSASRDTSAGKLRFAWTFAPRWTVRLLTESRHTTTDASILGTHLIRAVSPTGGTLDLTDPIDDATSLEVQDTLGRVEIENGGEHYSAWIAALGGDRTVDWTLPLSSTHVKRHTSGGALGGALHGNGFRVDGELEHGSFERYVFRTDPETTNRLTLRGRAALSHSFDLHAQGRFERATNPASEADVDHRADAVVIGTAWARADGKTDAGLDVDHTRIRTETSLTLPSVGTISVYDLDVVTTTAWGRTTLGRLRLTASASRVRDRGETFPLTSWNAKARLGYPLRDDLEVAVFGEKWSYDERRFTADDYDVSRYGVALRWRIK